MTTSVNDLKECEESWATKTKSILLKDAKIKDCIEIPMAFSQLSF